MATAKGKPKDAASDAGAETKDRLIEACRASSRWRASPA